MRIAVTDLDQYQYYLDADQDLDAYLANLLRENPMTPQLKNGIWAHEQLEKGGGDLIVGHWLDIQLMKPDAVEVPAVRTFNIGKREVTISGRLDAIVGLTGIDYKTTGRPIDLEKYMDAWQWKAYMLLCPALIAFRYEVFQTEMRKIKTYTPDEEIGDRLVVLDYKHLTCNRYDGLEVDVFTYLEEYIQFLKYLEERGHIRLTDYRPVRA